MGIQTQTVAGFTVDSREGTVTGPRGTVRLEPRVMEVLTVLSSRPGQVVSRGEILDAVWPDAVVTEHTLSRCIYQLRHELAKIGNKPESGDYNPIETLPKRGYRLLADLETQPVHESSAQRIAPPRLPVIPYVVGQWVRGERFYGRTLQIEEILAGHRNCIWLLGTRRIGKTSLLKQVEYLAETAADRRYFPLFWDFQGAETPEELHLNFADALLDADERLQRIGIGLEEVEKADLFASVEQLRRRLRSRNLGLLLLCDEVEELIKLHRKDPSLLRKLRHLMQSREEIRTVLASTIRLWALAEHREDTSPFLHGFTPPLYIERFTDREARSLIEQSHLDPESRPRFSDGVVEAISHKCDNHPYLVQLICKRYVETGGLDEAIEQVATDRMVSYFFSVDFEMLSDVERETIRMIARQPVVTRDSIRQELTLGADTLEGTLRRLENLGFVRRNDNREFALNNYFFDRWLKEIPERASEPVPVAATASPPKESVQDPESADAAAGSDNQLIAELKRRSVVRVGIAYVVVAWFLLQLGDIVFDFLEVPTWAGKLLIAFLVLGLPAALILAWAYEVTPHGVMREKDVDRSNTGRHKRGRKLDFIIIAILAIAVLLFALDKFG